MLREVPSLIGWWLGITVIIGLPSALNADCPIAEYGWTRTIGGIGDDWSETVTASPDGSVYVTGYCGSPNADFDPTEGTDIRPCTGLFVTKLNADGSYGWTHTYPGSNSGGIGRAIATDPVGDVLVTGTFLGNLDFDPTSSQDFHYTPATYALFVTKLGSDGSYFWTRTVGSFIVPDAIATGPDRSVAVTGSVQGNTGMDFDPGSGVDFHSLYGAEDIFVTKYDGDGNYAWTRTFGSASQFSTEGGIGVAIADDGAVLTVGRFRDVVDFDPGDGVDTHGAPNAASGFVTKFAFDGTYIWTRSFVGSNVNRAIVEAVSVDPMGTVYATGSSFGTIDFDPTAGYDFQDAGGGWFCTKLGVDGGYGWTVLAGGSAIDLDSRGNVLVAGGPTVMSITPQGVPTSVALFSYPVGPHIYAMDVGPNDQLVLQGEFYETVDFDPYAGVDSHTSNGTQDVFLTALDLVQPILFGDLNGSGTVDVDDILYVLAAFVDNDPCTNFPAANIVPCDESCEQGQIDVDDILAVLDAFVGIAACPVPCPAPS